jgi:hypothetical protein
MRLSRPRFTFSAESWSSAIGFAAIADGFSKKDASGLIRGVSSGAPREPTPEEVAAANGALFARNDAEALAAAARSLIPLYEVSADSLRTVPLPVLGLCGELDALNLNMVKRMAATVRGMEVVWLPGETHASSVRPSAAPLLAFLNKHRNP